MDKVKENSQVTVPEKVEKETDTIKRSDDHYKSLTKSIKEQIWGKGEWVDENDQSIFYYDSYKCRISRAFSYDKPIPSSSFGGYLCGYVEIPIDAVVDFYDTLNVHGGITYDRIEGEERWIGFDCAHCGDVLPYRSIQDRYDGDSYRNWDYVLMQVKFMVLQIKELSKQETSTSEIE